MTVEEKLALAQKKISHYEHQRILQENRSKDAQTKSELRRKILVGEIFIKHFPIAMEFIPGKSSDEDSQSFKPLEDFMEALAQCQQAFQRMEDELRSSN